MKKRIIVTAATGVLLATVTACGGGGWALVQVAPEIVTAAGVAGRSLEIPVNSIDDLARSARTSPTLVENVAQSGSRPVYRQWTASLRDMNARSQGPVRDAVVDAACDSLTEGTVDQTLADALGENGLDGLTRQKRIALFVDTVTLAQQLSAAAHSSDPEMRSAVAVFCWSAKVTG